MASFRFTSPESSGRRERRHTMFEAPSMGETNENLDFGFLNPLPATTFAPQFSSSTPRVDGDFFGVGSSTDVFVTEQDLQRAREKMQDQAVSPQQTLSNLLHQLQKWHNTHAQPVGMSATEYKNVALGVQGFMIGRGHLSIASTSLRWTGQCVDVVQDGTSSSEVSVRAFDLGFGFESIGEPRVKELPSEPPCIKLTVADTLFLDFIFDDCAMRFQSVELPHQVCNRLKEASTAVRTSENPVNASTNQNIATTNDLISLDAPVSVTSTRGNSAVTQFRRWTVDSLKAESVMQFTSASSTTNISMFQRPAASSTNSSAQRRTSLVRQPGSSVLWSSQHTASTHSVASVPASASLFAAPPSARGNRRMSLNVIPSMDSASLQSVITPTGRPAPLSSSTPTVVGQPVASDCSPMQTTITPTAAALPSLFQGSNVSSTPSLFSNVSLQRSRSQGSRRASMLPTPTLRAGSDMNPFGLPAAIPPSIASISTGSQIASTAAAAEDSTSPTAVGSAVTRCSIVATVQNDENSAQSSHQSNQQSSQVSRGHSAAAEKIRVLKQRQSMGGMKDITNLQHTRSQQKPLWESTSGSTASSTQPGTPVQQETGELGFEQQMASLQENHKDSLKMAEAELWKTIEKAHDEYRARKAELEQTLREHETRLLTEQEQKLKSIQSQPVRQPVQSGSSKLTQVLDTIAETECQLCYDKQADRVLDVCGHEICSDCLARLSAPCCPWDRQPFVTAHFKTSSPSPSTMGQSDTHASVLLSV
eukprot:GILK01003874.1.p1 GENE.GILK01003874.1~~GILK01003874.1.p1  ORF type:complete len:762 (-),score=143.93 GILK01003874.1:371-2656(-)